MKSTPITSMMRFKQEPPGGGTVLTQVLDAIRSLLNAKRADEYHVRAVFFHSESGQIDSCTVDKPIDRFQEVQKYYEEMGMGHIGYAVYGGSPPMHICGDQFSYRTASAIAAALRRFYLKEPNQLSVVEK